MITDYASLLTEIETWLNRSDLATDARTFVQLAEAKFRRDPRFYRSETRDPFTVDQDDEDLPSDLRAIDALYHDGPTYYFPLENVPAEKLSILKQTLGDSGVPRYYAVVGQDPQKLRFAPVPNDVFDLKLTYDWRLLSLSDTDTTNWLLLNHPDIYLYGSLIESAPYLKDDPRVATWKTEYEERVEQLHADTQRGKYSGTMTRRSANPIGG